MPTYQYTCTECGEPVEAVQKFTDAPLTVCAACGGRLRKVFSPVGIVFKGSGFYRTDSRNGSSSAAAAAKDKQSADSSAKPPRPNRPPTATARRTSRPPRSPSDRPAARPSRPRPRARRSPDRSWRTWPCPRGGVWGRPPWPASPSSAVRAFTSSSKTPKSQDRHPVRGAERPGHGGRGGLAAGSRSCPGTAVTTGSRRTRSRTARTCGRCARSASGGCSPRPRSAR